MPTDHIVSSSLNILYAGILSFFMVNISKKFIVILVVMIAVSGFSFAVVFGQQVPYKRMMGL